MYLCQNQSLLSFIKLNRIPGFTEFNFLNKENFDISMNLFHPHKTFAVSLKILIIGKG